MKKNEQEKISDYYIVTEEKITPQVYLQDVEKPPENLVRINVKDKDFIF